MSRSMVGGGIGSTRQDYFIHVAIMLGRRLTKAERGDVDSRRLTGETPVVIAESIALTTGEALTYPRTASAKAEASAD